MNKKDLLITLAFIAFILIGVYSMRSVFNQYTQIKLRTLECIESGKSENQCEILKLKRGLK